MCDSLCNPTADDLTFITLDPKHLETSGARNLSGQVDRLQRRTISEEEKANMRIVRAGGACLRCKILKKQCDGEQPCRQCPVQGFESPYDHWKVLGCYRGKLANFVDIFIPDWLEKDYREVVDPLGRRLTFRLSAKHTLLCKDKMAADVARMPSLDGRPGGVSSNQAASGYENPHKGTKYHSTDENINDLFKKSLEAAWELKELGKIEKFFLMRSAYSPFTLLLNMEDAEDRYPSVMTSKGKFNTWELARRIIVGACASYQREYQCWSSVNDVHNDVDYWYTTDVTVDVQHYSLPTLKDDLKVCLEILEVVCSRRNALACWEWAPMFYLLSAISIVQTILIDTNVLRCEYTGDPSRGHHNIIRIQSAYSALVSIFGRATGSFDPLLRGLNTINMTDHQATFDQAQQLAQIGKWKKRKIKSTKDFLRRLGKGVFPDGMYNGFVVQKQGLPQNLAAKSIANDLILHRQEPQEKMSQNKGLGENLLETITPAIPDLLTVLQDIENTTQTNETLMNTTYKEPEIAIQSSSSSSLHGMTISEGQRSGSTDRLNPRGYHIANHAKSHAIRQLDLQKIFKHSNSELWPATSVTNRIDRPEIFADRKTSSSRSPMSSVQSPGSSMSLSSLSREDIPMSGMSFSPHRSVSSSNLSSLSRHRIEASFLRDFNCCGCPLSTLHDLREHCDIFHTDLKASSASMPSNVAVADPDAENGHEHGDLGNAMFTEEDDFILSVGENSIKSWENWAKNIRSETGV